MEVKMQNDKRARLVKLFFEAGEAHGKAHTETNGEDAEWPIWYADHLKANLERETQRSFTRSEVIYFLVMADRKHRDSAKTQPWPEFYADLILTGNL